MAENTYFETPLSRLGRSELIATISIFLFRIKFPDLFKDFFLTIIKNETVFDQYQIVIILSLGLTFGLIINLVVEFSRIFITTILWGEPKFKIIKRLSKINKTISELIDETKKEIDDYEKKEKKEHPNRHYFKHPEKPIIFYNLVRTLGNRYSKICHTDSAEFLFRLSAYFIAYSVVLFIIAFCLLLPSNYNAFIFLSFGFCSFGFLFLLYSSYKSYQRLIELMELALKEAAQPNNVYDRIV